MVFGAAVNTVAKSGDVGSGTEIQPPSGLVTPQARLPRVVPSPLGPTTAQPWVELLNAVGVQGRGAALRGTLHGNSYVWPGPCPESTIL